MPTGDDKAGNYLSIDGGASGLSALYILEEILARLPDDLDQDEEERPSDHCSLIGGTGPGGLDAILVGRMRRTPSEALEAYMELESALSVPPTNDEDERSRNTEALEVAFSRVLIKAGFAVDTPMMDKNAPKTIVWTTSTINLSALYPIRSYRVSGARPPPCTILQAALATVAAPDRFLPISIGYSDHRRVTLIDAMLSHPNPTKQLLQEAQQVYGENAGVASVISIGAGRGEIVGMSNGGGKEGNTRTEMIALRCEETHNELEARLKDPAIYFRFNVARGLSGSVDSSLVFSHTRAYIQEASTSKLLDDAVESIKSRQKGTTLREINSVSVVETLVKPRPSVVQNFVGREEILEVMRQTHFGNRSPDSRETSATILPVITILIGLGGSGKTQTALKFAMEYEKRYPNKSIYFIDASSVTSIKADYELIIRSRGMAHRSKSSEDAIMWLATQKDGWLVIMDNADDPSINPYHFIPKCSYGDVIITTRNATHRKLAPNSSHDVEALSSPQAVELLLTSSSYPDTKENRAFAEAIANALGYLPLALAHAAGYISVHRCLSTYLDMYKKKGAKFLASNQTLPHDYNHSVATTIELSLERLPKQVRQLLEILAPLYPTSISHEVIVKAAERHFLNIYATSKKDLNPSTLKNIDVLMFIFCPSGEWDESDFNERMDQCFQYSLLRLTMSGNAKYYSMHVLVQTYLRTSAQNTEEYQPGKLAARLIASSITMGNNYSSFTLNRPIAPHLKYVALDDVVEPGDFRQVGQVLWEQGCEALSIRYLERCVEVWRKRFGEEHEETLIAMCRLSRSYYDSGRYEEALEMQEHVLKMRKRLSLEEKPETCLLMANLALSYRRMDRHKDAIEIQEQDLTIRKRLFGEVHPETINAMNQLAVCYSWNGRYQDAVELQERVLELQNQMNQKEHPVTLHAMLDLALSYEKLGRCQDALRLRKESLEMQTRLSSEEHPDTLNIIWDTLFTLEALGMKQQREDSLRNAVPLFEKVFGVGNAKTIQIRKWLNAYTSSKLNSE